MNNVSEAKRALSDAKALVNQCEIDLKHAIEVSNRAYHGLVGKEVTVQIDQSGIQGRGILVSVLEEKLDIKDARVTKTARHGKKEGSPIRSHPGPNWQPQISRIEWVEYEEKKRITP